LYSHHYTLALFKFIFHLSTPWMVFPPTLYLAAYQVRRIPTTGIWQAPVSALLIFCWALHTCTIGQLLCSLARKYVRVHAHVYVHMFVHSCAHVFVYAYCMYAYKAHVRRHATIWVYACMRVCMYAYPRGRKFDTLCQRVLAILPPGSK